MLWSSRRGLMTQNPCGSSAPTISSVTKDSEQIRSCLSGGWEVVWDVNLSKALSPWQEILVEHATDAAGTSWSTYGSYGSAGDTVVPVTRDDNTIGNDDQGSGSSTVYHKIRAYVVPIGGAVGDACSGPVTGPQESHNDYNCFA